MKIYRFLFAFLLILPFLQSCQEDICTLDDPRDAITKKWRVTDNSGTTAGNNGYDVTIINDDNDQTKILFTNFHGLGTTDKLRATLAGMKISISAPQVLDGDYTISAEAGTEVIGTISNDLKRIDFTYLVQEGLDPAEEFSAVFGAVITTKKKPVKVTIPL